MPANDTIQAYVNKLAPEFKALAAVLRTAIDRALPKATSKVWHGHPVWFDGENPVVGFDARKDRVNILFWNGQALDEPGLRPVGKYRAAGKSYQTADDVDLVELRRCLLKARANVFDGVTYFRALREAAARQRKVAQTSRTRAAKPSSRSRRG